MRILVADDQDDFREVICETIELSLPVKTASARDVAEAWCLLNDDRQPVDLAIIDLGMPPGGGMLLLSRIRTSKHLAQLPVIVVSGRADQSSVRQAAALGIQGYLLKPFANDALLGRLQQHLARFQEAKAAAASAMASAEAAAVDVPAPVVS